MMFKKQRKLESEGSKPATSDVSDDASLSAVQSASGNERTETPE